MMNLKTISWKKACVVFLVCTISAAAGFAQSTKGASKTKKAKAKTAQSKAAKPASKNQAKTSPKGKAAPSKAVAKPSSAAPGAAPKRTAPAVTATAPKNVSELNKALDLAKRGEYELASQRLFALTRNPAYAGSRMRIKYVLGLVLYEMKLYQVAAFQFVDVVRQSDARYLKQSLQKLSIIADKLDDDTLLNYAISKVNVEDFPKENRDMLRYRMGEYFFRRGDWKQAVENYEKVPGTSPYFSKAMYGEALAKVKTDDLAGALKNYSTIADNRESSGPTDINRVAALMGMARVYYQAKKWDLSVDMYRQVPRDTELWHDSLFEMSWAQMRAARFRSVLSNFHSLHSSYYEDFYLPESILLRGIVYLYICQYDEMEKTLALFERIYGPVQAKVDDFVRVYPDENSNFNEIERVIKNFDSLKADTDARKSLRLPFLVSRDISKQGDFKRVYSYLGRLRSEDRTINSQPPTWRRSLIGTYAHQLVQGRIDSTQKIAGRIVRGHLTRIKKELSEHFEQYGYAKYEMLNGKKEALKKKIAGKGVVAKQLDDSKDRSYYIQNGYEYWPFRGEYWLDEIGDYHYLGTQGCE